MNRSHKILGKQKLITHFAEWNPSAKTRWLPLQEDTRDKLEQMMSIITVFNFSRFVSHLHIEKVFFIETQFL